MTNERLMRAQAAMLEAKAEARHKVSRVRAILDAAEAVLFADDYATPGMVEDSAHAVARAVSELRGDMCTFQQKRSEYWNAKVDWDKGLANE
jgi:hypothetical protein